jgi:hypothetical protein
LSRRHGRRLGSAGACFVGLCLSAACEVAFPTKLATSDDAGIDGGDGSAGIDSGDSGDGASCDPTQPPSASPCVIAEAYGVFVAPSGSDANGDGSRAAPFATIGHGIAAASARSVRVYVCGATGVRYDEHVRLTDGSSVYGGLACPTGAATDWTYTGSPAEVAPTAGVALSAVALLSMTRVVDMAFTAGPVATDADAGAGAAGASIAAFLSSSSNLALTRVSFTSGAGGAGAQGIGVSNYGQPMAMAGNSAMNASQMAPAILCSCDDMTSSTGGQGGTQGAYDGVSGSSMPSVSDPVANGGVGQTTGCQGAPSTQPGADGALGAGAPMPTSFGTLTASGWIPSPPVAAATNGHPGQGGGGAGFDLTCAAAGGGAAGGGGGACGGCGGAAGTNGGAGGASFALVVYDSSVVLDGCTIVAGNGGEGGGGGDGQAGQPGGGVGPGACCDGTAGGNGGGGGGGAGGAGGPAFGIAFSGTAPDTSNTTITHGVGGKGGIGGSASAGPPRAGGSGPEGPSGAAMPF